MGKNKTFFSEYRELWGSKPHQSVNVYGAFAPSRQRQNFCQQAKNAARVEEEGGAIVSLQKNIGPVRLAQLLTRLIDGGADELHGMASAAKNAGRPDAVERLADEVLALVGPNLEAGSVPEAQATGATKAGSDNAAS